MKLTWDLAYYGWSRNYISSDQILRDIEPTELDKLDSDIIANLYSAADESREAFGKVLASIVQESSLIDHQLDRRWTLHFLEKILASNESIKEKLREVASIWSLFEYPPDWRQFIYYMPREDGKTFSENEIYNMLKNYVEKEREDLIA